MSARADPPRISLWAWAVEVAADIQARGPELQVIVGCLRFPDRAPVGPLGTMEGLVARAQILGSAWISTRLDAPLTVRSGFEARHAMVFTNLGDDRVRLPTNGAVTAHVLQPQTGRLVGISTQVQPLPLACFDLAPLQSVSVPLIVGTASVEPGLGYAVPPGHWQLSARVTVERPMKGSRWDFVTPGQPLEII